MRQRPYTLEDVIGYPETGVQVRAAFHAPDLLSGAEIGQRDSAAEQLGISYGEADAGFDDASTELKIRKAETVPGADKWVQDAPENVTFLQEDADGLMAVYQSLRDSGFLSQDDLDEGTVREIAQSGNGIVDTLERARLANERTDIGAAVRSGSLDPDAARAKLTSIDTRMAALAKRRGDVSGFYSFMEQGYRMATRDIPQAGYRALEGGLAGASAGAIAGTIAGTAVPVVGNLTGAVGGSVAGGIAGVGAGLARGMAESAQNMEEANFLADLLNEKDDAGNYLDVEEIREKARLYGMGSALVEMAGDALSMGAAKLIAPVLKTAAANLGGKSLQLFTKDAIKSAIKNKQAWPVMRRFFAGMAAGAAAEGAEEAVQEGVSASIEAWLKNSLNEQGRAYYRDEQPGLFSAETWAAMRESGLEGAKVGAWFVLLPGIAQLFVDAGKVSRAREFAQGVKDVGSVVANSATAQMAPARMDSFLQMQGLNQTVYIPADAAWQMQGAGTDLVSALGWTQESLEEAASLGHDIAVPLSRLVSRLDSGTLNAVADIMREGPHAVNVFESEDPNAFLQADVDAINAAAEEWEFEQDMLDAELERVRTSITEAVRSVPGLLNQIVGSVDPETSVSTYVDTIMTIIEQAAQRLRVYGDDVGSIVEKLNFEGLFRGSDGRMYTAEEMQERQEAEAQAEADRPFWDNVWGRLNADSLKRDFPDARRELAKAHGSGLFAKKGEGIAVDELADILKNAGWLDKDADSSTLVEMLKSKKRPKARKAGKSAQGLFQSELAEAVIKDTEKGGSIKLGDGSYVYWNTNRDTIEVYDEEGIPEYEEGPEYMLIDSLYVAPESRRNGLGRRLLRSALNRISRTHPGIDIRLDADPIADEAVALEDLVEFYSSEGFDIEDADGASGVPMVWDRRPRWTDSDTLFQRAWHGSLYDFDRFDLSFVGAGEGAQAHGYGLYVALTKKTANERYRKRLTEHVKPFVLSVDGAVLSMPEERVLDNILISGEVYELSAKELKSRAKEYLSAFEQELKDLEERAVPDDELLVETRRRVEVLSKLANAKKIAKKKNKGQLFEVDIPEDSVMLHESANMEEQPAFVRDAAKRLYDSLFTPKTEEHIALEKEKKELGKKVSANLKEIQAAIDAAGIKYSPFEKDGFERAAEKASPELFKEYRVLWKQSEDLKKRMDAIGEADTPFEELTGHKFYGMLSQKLKGARNASLKLNEYGIKGIRYHGGIDGECAVVFDDQAIEVIDKYYAMQADGSQSYSTANIQRLEDGDFLIRLFRGANLSTLAHEISHAVHMEMERIEREGKGTDALKRDLDTLRRWQSKYDDETALRAEYDRYYKGLYGVEFDELDAMTRLAVKQRAQREMVARGFELYLREGEAPTPGMEAVFRRMGKWMKRVYQNASQLDVEINDEVRGVFDRWLASEEDIAAAAAANDIHGFTAPLLDSLGLQGADRLELEGMISDAMGKASDALRRDRARYRREHMQQWRDEVEQELANDPVYQARAAMRRTPIDLDAVVDAYGQELADQLRVKLPASMKRGGDNPELLAFDYGFDDAGQMLRAIINRPGTQERRKELLAQKMQDADAQFAAEDYLFEQEELRQREDKVGEALYRLELGSKTALGRPVTPEQQDFEDFGSAEKTRWNIAREQLRTTVSRLLDEKEAQAAIRPDSYRRAAAKAMREERKAILAKDWAEAVRQNYLARVNMEAAYQAGKRRDLVNKLRRQAKRFLDSATPDIRARFAVFGLSQRVGLFDPTMKMVQNAADKSIEDIREFLEKMKDEGFYTVDATIPETLFEGSRQDWKLMDWKDLQPYLEGMAVLMHMERESRKANSEAAKAEWREEMDGIAASILALNNHREAPADQKRLAIVQKLREIHASHLKAESICLLLDGDQERGPVWTHVILPINRAQADKDRRMKQARDDMQKLFGVYSRNEWVDIRGKRIHIPSLGRALSKEQMLAIMLNAGNESNLDRLRHSYTDEQIREIIDMLDERDVKFVQSVWDYLETFRKESFDLEEKLTGVRPQAIEAKPLQTRFGELRGGYYPVSYDSQNSSLPIDTESIGTLTGSMMPAVDHGSMKQRTATGLSAPLKLDLEVVPRHVAKTAHMLAFREPVRQVARVLNDRAVNAAIESTMGVEISKALKSWLHYVAGERPGANGWSRALSMLRKNSALYSMGFKLTTILAQLTGLLSSTAEIGPRWVAAGLVRTYCNGNPFTVYRETAALSPMMENRMRSVDRDLYEMSTGLMAKGSSNKVLDKFVWIQHVQEQYAFLPVGLVQMAFADLPTWQGAYAKALHEGRSQSEAIEYADAIVARTQVGGADKDLAAVQRGQELGKIMTQFYSYFSALYQLYARRMTMLKRKGIRNREAWARLGTLFLLTGIAEPIISAIFTFDTPEDDEDWSAWMAKKVFFNPWNMVVGVRDVFGAVESLVDGYGGKSRAASLLNDSIDTGVRFLSQLAKGEDMDPRAALKAGWKNAGLLTGMVNAQELLFLEAFVDWLEGTNPDFEWADLVRRKK